MLSLTRTYLRPGIRGKEYVNVTAKLATGLAEMFAPSWDLVMSHKQGRLTNAGYTEGYHTLLESIPLGQILHFQEAQLAVSPTCVFTCFCPDGAWCHTHLLIDWLVENHPLLFADVRQPWLKPQ